MQVRQGIVINKEFLPAAPMDGMFGLSKRVGSFMPYGVAHARPAS
ncbi:hypothetical protein N9B88_02600 [Rubripirellula sp.]|nr:hypothetical protein [Rubripirellula sp.]